MSCTVPVDTIPIIPTPARANKLTAVIVKRRNTTLMRESIVDIPNRAAGEAFCRAMP
jgi:hypothetical protein